MLMAVVGWEMVRSSTMGGSGDADFGGSAAGGSGAAGTGST